ncbi:Vacuolar protein sorting-associated protein 74 [Entomophthora muscae]|uniref:Vacuolar protein sorting-associated protein 74 n=1 Tax=Entomophthora muscae TaxID=34485 RepID=A0ACC2T120_9FUNG|nr:Vacuolar protein sorting-associated protein 74 [Entomophthora muscae]
MEGLTKRKNAGLARRSSFDDSEEDIAQRDKQEQEDATLSADFKPFQPPLTLMDELYMLAISEDGSLSFWNDSLSYVLRACIMIELVLRQRIQFISSPINQPFPSYRKRITTAVDKNAPGKPIGEFLLDEALRIMATSSETLDVSSWISYLNGETWNPTKLGYQLKMVRERIGKGLVEKGVLKHDRKLFAIFEQSVLIPRSPLIQRELSNKVRSLLLSPLDKALSSIHYADYPEQTPFLRLRFLLLALATYSAEILDNIIDETFQESAMSRAECLLSDLSVFPPPLKLVGLLGISQENHAVFLPYFELISAIAFALKNL